MNKLETNRIFGIHQILRPSQVTHDAVKVKCSLMLDFPKEFSKKLRIRKLNKLAIANCTVEARSRKNFGKLISTVSISQ